MECNLSMGLKKGLVGILSKVQLNIRDHTAVLFMPSALQTSPGPEQEALCSDALARVAARHVMEEFSVLRAL